MSELTQAQLLELVNTKKMAPGNARVRQLTERIVTDLFKTIAGTLPPHSAVSYVSLGQALEAVASGVPVKLLPVDKIEPETPTVKDGRYTLRRPVLLLSHNEPDPLVEAFEQFALSEDGQKIISESYTPLPKTSSP